MYQTKIQSYIATIVAESFIKKGVEDEKETIEPVEYEEDGELVFNLNADAANADWLRAARLQRKAEEGDHKAAKELQRLFKTEMVQFIDEK